MWAAKSTPVQGRRTQPNLHGHRAAAACSEERPQVRVAACIDQRAATAQGTRSPAHVPAAHGGQPHMAFAPQVRRKVASQSRRAPGAQRSVAGNPPTHGTRSHNGAGCRNLRNRHRASGFCFDMGGEEGIHLRLATESGSATGGSTQAQLLAAARSCPAPGTVQGHAPRCWLTAALPPRGGCRGRNRPVMVPARRLGPTCHKPLEWRRSRPFGAAGSRTCSSGAQRGTDH